MSDETPAPSTNPMQDQGRPPLIINGQYVKDLSFEAPNTPQIFSTLQGEQPSIKVDIDVQAEPKAENLFEVALKVRAEARAKEQLVYLLEVAYAGLFTLNVAEEQVGPVLLIECPLILFPFLRRIVADLSGDGGFAPLMLSPIDFSNLYRQRIQQMQAQRGQTAQA
jgi:preprotein translocase subunit SecB